MAEATVSVREAASQLAHHGIAAADAYGRPDLANHLRTLEQRAAAGIARVLVVGEFKQGKTSLVNALVGADVSPVDADAATVVPVAVGWGAHPSAAVVITTDHGVEQRAIELGSLRRWALEYSAHADGSVRGVEIALPAEPLRDGLVLVDFPGVGGLGSFMGVLVLAALPSADAVLFVSDAAQELTAAEREFLERVAPADVPVALVKSRTDIHPDWRRVLAADSEHAAPIVHASVGVSSEVSAKGRESGDAELARESGIPQLGQWLDTHVVKRADRRRAARMTEEVERVAVTLHAQFEAERTALKSPPDADALASDLARAQAEADRLRSAGSRWQQALVDVFSDLAGDVDHNLRAAVRLMLADAEATIDELDPAKVWEKYEPELRRTVAGLVADHYAALQDRVALATTQVARVFSDDSDTVEDLVRRASPDVSARHGMALDDPVAIGDTRRQSVGGQALVMLRASYGGALMVGFGATIVGLAIATPAVLAVGGVLGIKGVREENARRLALRRATAKSAVRKLVDNVLFEVGKDSRDTVRLAQRQLRVFFVQQADELMTSATATLRAVNAAAQQDATTRAARLEDVDAEIDRLTRLVAYCGDLRRAVEATGVTS
jgi:hypothetical protein